MPRYRKKPVEIEAVTARDMLEVPWDLLPHWLEHAYATGRVRIKSPDGVTGTVVIDTLEGPLSRPVDDCWIIRGIQGELYPVARDIFEATYERVA